MVLSIVEVGNTFGGFWDSKQRCFKQRFFSNMGELDYVRSDPELVCTTSEFIQRLLHRFIQCVCLSVHLDGAKSRSSNGRNSCHCFHVAKKKTSNLATTLPRPREGSKPGLPSPTPKVNKPESEPGGRIEVPCLALRPKLTQTNSPNASLASSNPSETKLFQSVAHRSKALILGISLPFTQPLSSFQQRPGVKPRLSVFLIASSKLLSCRMKPAFAK